MSSSSSKSLPFITAFYSPSHRKQDAQGRTLEDILNFSDNQLEYYHDYIQYLFPLPERSPINPRAPVITKEVREAFLAQPELRKNLRRALDRMLEFYGFTLTPFSASTNDDDTNTGENDTSVAIIVPGDDFEYAAKHTWLKRFDHNHLRITRIIRSLRVLGLEAEARSFYRALVENDARGRVSERSLMFWERAAVRGLHLAPEEEDEGAEGLRWLRKDEEGEE